MNKGLPLSVYRNADGFDGTNGGVSAAHTRLILVGTKRHGEDIKPLPQRSQVFEVTDAAPAVVLVESACPGLYGPHLEPLEYVDAHNTQQYAGPMAGGNYAASSDGRVCELSAKVFGHSRSDVFPIHDRVETWALYNAMSSD